MAMPTQTTRSQKRMQHAVKQITTGRFFFLLSGRSIGDGCHFLPEGGRVGGVCRYGSGASGRASWAAGGGGLPPGGRASSMRSSFIVLAPRIQRRGGAPPVAVVPPPCGGAAPPAGVAARPPPPAGAASPGGS
uniref:Uncharacterized protein n=1 Tax=Arundo donax TaxID=35708 RepID=A0A0A9FMN8_ARUDO